jgi:hypothetical protein
MLGSIAIGALVGTADIGALVGTADIGALVGTIVTGVSLEEPLLKPIDTPNTIASSNKIMVSNT